MIDSSVRRLVRQRAGHRWEYCRIEQAADPLFRFHIEHVRPRQHGGHDADDNLALACAHCDRFKGPNLTAIDPAAGSVVPLFDPRSHIWTEHFGVSKGAITGFSPIGRAAAVGMAPQQAFCVAPPPRIHRGGQPGDWRSDDQLSARTGTMN